MLRKSQRHPVFSKIGNMAGHQDKEKINRLDNSRNILPNETLHRMEIIKNLPIRRFIDGSRDFQEKIDSISRCFEDKEYEKAISFIKEAEFILNNGQDKNILLESELLCLKGFSFLGTSDINSAKTNFERGLEINPSSSLACIGLADIFLSQGELDSAKTMYEWGCINDPDNKLAISRLQEIKTILELKEIDNPSTDSDDHLFSDLFLKAIKLYKASNYRTALETIDSAIEMYRPEITYEEIYLLKGNIYLSLDDLEEAKTAFEFALNENSFSSEATLGLGTKFYRLEMLNEAKIMLEWAVKNNVQNLTAKDYLEEVNRLLGYNDNHSSLHENSEFTELQEIQSENILLT
jgi:tetratricopeptide (TPR) repeat protein